MSRIAQTFSTLAAQGRKVLIPFITAGDPAPAATVPLMHSLVAAGANILELGVPFSDPMAEGPVIQRACERALKFNVSIHDVLGYVREFRQRDSTTPVVLMGYANPIEHMGQANFVAAAREAGVDGTIVVDYPPEECEQYAALMAENGMDTIFLLAPTSTEERMAQVGKLGSGFCYYVSLRGVTGAAHIDLEDVSRRIEAVRKYVSLPIGVGFGIRDGETARAVASVADAVVIGSRIIQEIENHPADQAAEVAGKFLAGIRAALDA